MSPRVADAHFFPLFDVACNCSSRYFIRYTGMCFRSETNFYPFGYLYTFENICQIFTEQSFRKNRPISMSMISFGG